MSDLFVSHFLVLLLMGIVFVPLGLYVFSLAEKRAKKIGTLKRSG